jgi:integrase
MAGQRLEKTTEPGIYRVHERVCDGYDRCRCAPSYQVRVYVAATGKRPTKHFPTMREAKAWKSEALGAVRAGRLTTTAIRRTIGEAADELLAGMRDGTIVNRSHRPYKPATVRSYERALRLRILPELGRMRLGEVRRGHVQRFAEALVRDGMEPSTVLNTLDPLRVILRRAIDLDEVNADPTAGLRLPRPKRRTRTVSLSAKDALELVGNLPAGERALWAVAFFCGLRRGELRALRWTDVDLAAAPATIRVARTWDDEEGELDEAKTEAGTRTVALPAFVAQLLAAHGLTTSRAGRELVFGRTAELPFVPSTVRSRALKAWGEAYVCTHQARHAAASFLSSRPDVSLLELTRSIGHSDVRTTLNIYGHLLPDSGARVAGALDALIAEAQNGS